jgi:hypothetical protein
MNSKGIAIVAGGILLAAGPLAAEELTRTVTDVATITEPEHGAGRVLFRAEIPAPEGHVAVRRARVRIPLAGLELPEPITLRVHPVTAEWDAGTVSWTGWSRPGGDFEERVHGRAELSGGEGEAVFDVTILAKEILEHGVPNRGFLLTVDPAQGVGIPSAALDAWTLQGATLEIQYRRVPPPPRGVG